MSTRGLTGPQKAATLMLALGEEQASRIFSQLHEDEIRDLSQAMAALGNVPAAQVEEVAREFRAALGQTGHLVGSFEVTERLLLRTLPKERVSQIMEEIRGPAGLLAGAEPALARPAEAAIAAGGAPALPGASAEDGVAAPDALVNIARVDGQIRASALQALAQLVDENPDQSVGVLRRWLMPEEEPA